MEVFSDYQCPACRGFFENTLRYMINDYVASGKVYLVHRDFPLPMHPYSIDALVGPTPPLASADLKPSTPPSSTIRINGRKTEAWSNTSPLP